MTKEKKFDPHKELKRAGEQVKRIQKQESVKEAGGDSGNKVSDTR